MKKLIAINILLIIAFMSGAIYAQSGLVNIIGSAPGTTLANCGTPTTPSICGVATGWYVWQSAASGWVLIGAAGPAPTPPSVSINGVAKVCNTTCAFALSVTQSTITPQ